MELDSSLPQHKQANNNDELESSRLNSTDPAPATPPVDEEEEEETLWRVVVVPDPHAELKTARTGAELRALFDRAYRGAGHAWTRIEDGIFIGPCTCANHDPDCRDGLRVRFMDGRMEINCAVGYHGDYVLEDLNLLRRFMYVDAIGADHYEKVIRPGGGTAVRHVELTQDALDEDELQARVEQLVLVDYADVDVPTWRAVIDRIQAGDDGAHLALVRELGFIHHRHVYDSLDGVERVPYRLLDIILDIKDGRPIFIVQDEETVHHLVGMGVSATTCLGGLPAWQPELGYFLRNARDITIVPTDDEEGRESAGRIAAQLRSHGVKEVRVCLIP